MPVCPGQGLLRDWDLSDNSRGGGNLQRERGDSVKHRGYTARSV